MNRTDPTGLFDPVAEAIMRDVSHPLPTTAPLTWADFIPGGKTLRRVLKVLVRYVAETDEYTDTISEVEVSVVEGVAVKGNNGKCGNSSKNKGDCAEALVNKKYGKNGWTEFNTKDIENGSGHGIDNILTKGDDIVVIETKTNTARLNRGQKLGGAKYLDKQLTEMIRGFEEGKGRWARYYKNKEFGRALRKLQKLLKGHNPPNFKICRVKLEDDPTGCYGKGGNGTCKGTVDCSKAW